MSRLGTAGDVTRPSSIEGYAEIRAAFLNIAEDLLTLVGLEGSAEPFSRDFQTMRCPP